MINPWLNSRHNLIQPSIKEKTNNKGGLSLGNGGVNRGKGKGATVTPDGYNGATDPLISSVVLLTNFENSNSTDDPPIIGLANITANQSTFGTTQPKFGSRGWIAGADTNAVLTPNVTGNYAPGTGDFAFEMWVYLTAVQTTVFLANGSNSSNVKRLQVEYSAGNIEVFTGSTLSPSLGFPIQAALTITTNTWHFLQLIRVNGVLKLGWDGVQKGSDFADTNDYSDTHLWFGGANFASPSRYPIPGYLDAFRYTRGAANSFGTNRRITLPTTFFPVA